MQCNPLTALKYSPEGSLLWAVPIQVPRRLEKGEIRPDEKGGCYILGFYNDSGLFPCTPDFGYEPDAARGWKYFLAHIRAKPKLSLGPLPSGSEGGSLSLTLVGEPGRRYGIESSTNLTDWSSISEVEDPRGLVELPIPSPTNSPGGHFYRVVDLAP